MNIVLNSLFAILFIAAAAYHICCILKTKKLYLESEEKIKDFFIDLFRTIEGSQSVSKHTNIKIKLEDFLQHVRDDVHSILGPGTSTAEQVKFKSRYLHKREERGFLDSPGFSVAENLSRRLIEIYPPIGILGTVVGLYFGMNGADPSQILSNFSTAMWTTIVGLILWIFSVVYIAKIEPIWELLPECQKKARDILWDIERVINAETPE